MSTIVGQNIEVANIKYDSDTTSMIISNNGQVTIQGENTNTTNLQQGLLKYWNAFNGDGGDSYDSFNNSGKTDHGTNDHTFTFTTAFASANYTVTFGGGNNDATGGSFLLMICDHHLSTYLRCQGGYADGTANYAYQWQRNHLQLAGDLA
mgnify:CR=1 FL=1